MTRSVLALVAVAGCWGADQQAPALLSVKRVHVERLNGESSAQIRDMIINALQASRLFVLTENPDKADATLRGSAEDLIYNDHFQSGEQVSARANVGSSTTSSRRVPGVGIGIGLDESTRSTERKHEAAAAVRLVSRDGDVIWSTTQESTGAKFRGASADVAEKIVRQLLADIEKVRRPEPALAR
jgi:hypothetical protein